MSFKNVFSLKHVKHSFSVVFKKREDGSRHLIILLVIVFGVYTYANTGTQQNINLPYAKRKFKWDSEAHFNNWWAIYSAATYLCQAFGIGAIMPVFTQVIKLNDLLITILCVASFVMGMVTIVLSTNANMLYLAAALQMFASLATTSVRSALSKIISKHDIGKVSLLKYILKMLLQVERNLFVKITKPFIV